jgi:2-alkyl-3-oxoalkanoate reductase
VKVLVTGATSTMGASLVERLLRRGDAVTTLQRRPSDRHDGRHEVLGDITSPESVASAVVGQEAVVHLAAKVDVAGRWHDFQRTNVDGTRHVVMAARASGVRRFVHVSSPSVAHGGRALVGAGAGPADPTVTRGHYATSKAMAERLALTADDERFAVLALRPHLVWGPGDHQLVGRLVDRRRANRLAIIGSGAALVDSTYLDNAADALVAALDRAPELRGEALVVSNGEPRPVGELINGIVSAAGLTGPRIRVPKPAAFVAGLVIERVWERFGRTDDPPITSFLAEQLTTAHWFDQRRTRRKLKWTPAVSIDDGLERLAGWYASQAFPC